MHLLAWTFALGFLSLSPTGIGASPRSRLHSIGQDPAPAPAPEPESAALKEARALFAKAKEARERKDLDEARAQAAQSVGVLVGLAPGELSAKGVGLLSELGIFTREVGDSKSARVARERVVLELEQRLPADHPDLTWAWGNLANTLFTLGDLQGARALRERVLEVRERTLPPDHPDLATARGNMAVTLRTVGDLSAARALQERVLEVLERTLPADDPDLAWAREGLAATLIAIGDLSPVRALLTRVLEVRERTLPADHADLATVRANLAVTLKTLGDLDAARALEERVLEVWESTLPADHPDLAAARANLAATLFAFGDLQAARTLQGRVLEVFERTLPADHPDLAVARQGMACTFFTLGDLQAARALFERVLEIRERILPADHPDLAHARLSLAATLLALGEISAARALDERALEVLERTLPADHPKLALARLNLAGVLKELGDLQAARALDERVLEVRERTLPDDHPDLMAARGNLAATLTDLGDLSAARFFQERVLEVLERTRPADHLDLATARGNLAVTLYGLGDLPTARALQERVLEVLERTLPAEHTQLAHARLNLANTLATLGNLPAARALFERLLEVLERTLPPDHPDLALARRNLAITLCALLGCRKEESREEEEGMRSALRTLALDLSRGLRRSARSALLEGSPREVEERLASQDAGLGDAYSLACGFGIVGLGDDVRIEIFLLGESSRAGGLIASRLAARAGSDEVGKKLRARIAAETETLARLAQSGGSAEELGRARTAIDQAGQDLAHHASGLFGSEAAIDPTLEDLTRGLGPLEALVAWRRATISTLLRGDPATWSHVDSLIAFVVRPGVRVDGHAAGKQSPRLELVDLGPAVPIETATERWRKSIGTPVERGVAVASGGPSLVDLGNEVRARMLDPLHGALEGVERVIAVLDDALHAVPLDALPAGDVWGKKRPGAEASKGAGDSLRPLGDVLEIEVRSSLIELLLPEEPLAGETTLLAIGHPAFDADPASTEEMAEETGVLAAAATRSGEAAGMLRGGMWERGFGTLPETRAEVRGIVQYFEDTFGEKVPSVLLERRKASREALIELAPHARWLHVATHGWFAPDSVRSSAEPEPEPADTLVGLRLGESERVRGMSPMLLCGLALAGANLPMNAVGRIPGLVTAQEIAALDLSSCELAVLSACDTNVGVRRAGQGVASLQRALHMAGARSVITSLWKVPDEATKDLMIDFYRRLWLEKKPKHQALWEAKTKLRNAKDESGNLQYTPRDWAPWVLTGSPD